MLLLFQEVRLGPLMDQRKNELEGYMTAALVEGRKALPACLPNPPVGCVIVHSDRIISRGFTNAPGEWHAETMALSQVDGPLVSSAAFVTLEPCSFHGRTPSCALALIERKIGQVFVGILDPHPRNQGRGIQLMQDAGIQVEVGLLADEVLRDLGQYLAMG